MAAGNVVTKMRVVVSLFAAGMLMISTSLVKAQSTEKCSTRANFGSVEAGAVYIPLSPEANQCWGFISSVRERATLADQEGKTFLNACPNPDGISRCRLFVVFIE